MIFLVNPQTGRKPRRTRTTRVHRGGQKRKSSAKQIAARKAFAAKYGNAGSGEGVKARRTSERQQRRQQEGTMAQRKRSKRRRSMRRNPRKVVARKRSTTRRKRAYHAVRAHKRKGTSVRSYHQNPRRRRHRRSYGFRRNPGGVVGQVIGAAKDVATVVVGKAATNYVSRMIPFGGTSKAMTAGKKLAIAIGLSMIAKKVVSQRVADLILVGGILGPVEDFASTLPVIGTALQSDTSVSTTAALGSYVAAALPSGDGGRMSKIGTGMGAYVRPASATGGGY